MLKELVVTTLDVKLLKDDVVTTLLVKVLKELVVMKLDVVVFGTYPTTLPEIDPVIY